MCSPSCNWQPGEKYETIRAVENILYSTEKRYVGCNTHYWTTEYG